jgi:hypothetical protein
MSLFGLQSLAENNIYDTPLPSQRAQMNWCNENIFDRPLNNSVHLISTRIYTSTQFLTHPTLFKERDHGANVGMIGIKNQSGLKRRLRHLNQGLQNETVQVESATTDFPDGVFRTEIGVLIVLKTVYSSGPCRCRGISHIP